VLRVLDEKTVFVQKHRRRLQKDSAKATEEAVERYRHLLGEVEQARLEALETRRSELWAQLFPSETITQDVESRLLLGGLRLKEVSWTKERIAIEEVLAVLRADCEWVRRAQTAAQQAEIEGRDPRVEGRAVWAGSEEDQEQQRRERQATRERIEKERHSEGWEE